MYTVCKLFK